MAPSKFPLGVTIVVGSHELHEIRLKDKAMSQVLFIVAPHSTECNAEVHPDRSEARRLVNELVERSLAYRVVVIDPVSRKWWQTEAPYLADPEDKERQSLPQRSDTPELLFVVVPHIAGPPASVCVNLEIAAETACSYPEGCRVVVVNSDATDIPKWKERRFEGPVHCTALEQLQGTIVEGLTTLADDLATDG